MKQKQTNATTIQLLGKINDRSTSFQIISYKFIIAVSIVMLYRFRNPE